MKKYFLYTIILAALAFQACVDMNLNPLSEAASGNWNSIQEQVEMSINDLYKSTFWGSPTNELATDDQVYRDILSYNKIADGTINGETNNEPKVVDTWFNAYKAIGRANYILSTISRADEDIDATLMKRYIGEVKFVRACQYAKLTFLYGDVVYYTEPLVLSEAYKQGQTPRAAIMQYIYEDFDSAIESLPKSYESGNKRFTQGIAYAMKARTALHYASVLKFDKNPDLTEAEKHFKIARDAAKSCMDLNIYSLHADFGALFSVVNKQYSSEYIYATPLSIEYNVYESDNALKGLMPRLAGGFAADEPTWDLFCSFLCTDGKTIAESSLYDPRNPFANRDPRCTYTIVEFGTPHLGYIYNPHPDATTTLRLSDNVQVPNNDSKGGTNTASSMYASYNGLLYKKGVDEAWLSFKIDPYRPLVRYADVLLMYAEAKIELNEIDQSVRDAMNEVRARAYKVKKENTTSYPEITTSDQLELRKILRIERRMEFAREGLRYYDIIRWRIAEKNMNLPVYGLLNLADLRSKIVTQGLWFFPSTPAIDENGTADFSAMHSQGYIKFLAQRHFDATRQYLWPLPTKEILTNPTLNQNPNY